MCVPGPVSASAPAWSCTTSPSSSQLDAALVAFNSFKGNKVRYVVGQDYDSDCSIPNWVIKPRGIDFRLKKVCTRRVWTSATGGRTITHRNFTVSFTDSCKRRVNLQLDTRFTACNAKYSPVLAGHSDPLLLPTAKVHAIKLQKNYSAGFPDEKCPPDAPILLRQHNPHYNPNTFHFYEFFLPSFQRVWWPRQERKPFSWRSAYTAIGYGTGEGVYHDGSFACTSNDGRLVGYITVNVTRYPGWEPTWSGHFFFNATTVNPFECGTSVLSAVFKLA